MIAEQTTVAQLLAASGLVGDALGSAAAIQALGENDDPPMLRARLSRPGARSLNVVFVPLGADLRRIPSGSHPVLVAQRAPKATIARWREARQSFVDLPRRVYLDLPGYLVDKELRRARRPAPERPLADPFADRASLVTRTLLETPPGRTWGVRELAAESGVAPGTASGVLRALAALGSVSLTRTGRDAVVAVDDPSRLLRAWTDRYEWTRNASLALAAPVADPEAFIGRLASMFGKAIPDRRWALTLQGGASLVAPHAAWDRIQVYIEAASPAELAAIAARLRWPSARDGKLVLMRPFYRDALWTGVRELKRTPVVSDLQLALDLWHYPVRGLEQAEHVLARRLPWLAGAAT